VDTDFSFLHFFEIYRTDVAKGRRSFGPPILAAAVKL